MKYIQMIFCLLITSLVLMTSAQAHDPSLHVKKNEAPNCESMEAMDYSKMDEHDPVMMAMMKKCKSQTEKHHEGMDHSNTEMDHGNKKTETKNKHHNHH